MYKNQKILSGCATSLCACLLFVCSDSNWAQEKQPPSQESAAAESELSKLAEELLIKQKMLQKPIYDFGTNDKAERAKLIDNYLREMSGEETKEKMKRADELYLNLMKSILPEQLWVIGTGESDQGLFEKEIYQLEERKETTRRFMEIVKANPDSFYEAYREYQPTLDPEISKIPTCLSSLPLSNASDLLMNEAITELQRFCEFANNDAEVFVAKSIATRLLADWENKDEFDMGQCTETFNILLEVRYNHQMKSISDFSYLHSESEQLAQIEISKWERLKFMASTTRSWMDYLSSELGEREFFGEKAAQLAMIDSELGWRRGLVKNSEELTILNQRYAHASDLMVRTLQANFATRLEAGELGAQIMFGTGQRRKRTRIDTLRRAGHLLETAGKKAESKELFRFADFLTREKLADDSVLDAKAIQDLNRRLFPDDVPAQGDTEDPFSGDSSGDPFSGGDFGDPFDKNSSGDPFGGGSSDKNLSRRDFEGNLNTRDFGAGLTA
jgi:hypothetical protein